MRFRKFLKPYKTRGSSFREHTRNLGGKMMRRIMLLCGMIAVTVSGCTYVNNKSWDDMTPEEQEEVRQVFEEERKELEEDENMSDNGFAQYILDKVEEAVDTQSF